MTVFCCDMFQQVARHRLAPEFQNVGPNFFWKLHFLRNRKKTEKGFLHGPSPPCSCSLSSVLFLDASKMHRSMSTPLGQLLTDKLQISLERTRPTPAYERFPKRAFRYRDWGGFTRHGRGDSYPLYTQDTMRNMAAHLFDFSTGYESNRAFRVKPCDLVYSTFRPLHGFLKNVHAHIHVPYLLLTDTSDLPIDHSSSDVLLKSSTLFHWWASDNTVLDNSKISSVPLGIDDNLEPPGVKGDVQSVVFHANITFYLSTLRKVEAQSKTRWLMVQMSTTHTKRRNVRKIFNQSWGDGEIKATPEKSRMRMDTYLHVLGRHRFIVSPRGNGLDTHRTWEALLVGTIPIVQSSALDVLYDKLPVLVVEEWSDVTPKRLRQFYREYMAKRSMYNYHKLFADYWIGNIAVQQERCLARERARRAPDYRYAYNRKGGWVLNTSSDL